MLMCSSITFNNFQIFTGNNYLGGSVLCGLDVTSNEVFQQFTWSYEYIVLFISLHTFVFYEIFMNVDSMLKIHLMPFYFTLYFCASRSYQKLLMCCCQISLRNKRASVKFNVS